MIGILDYGMGNLMSVSNALDYLKIKNTIVDDPKKIRSLSHLIIPGVGAFPYAMEMIKSGDLYQPVLEFANEGNPVLGICLGMQLLASKGEEVSTTDGLNLVPGLVTRLVTEKPIPHMGWNGLNFQLDHPILNGIKRNSDVYFVHSFYFKCLNEANILATTEYGKEFPSMVVNNKGNVIGAQFHPEKSQKQGLRMLKNFSEM